MESITSKANKDVPSDEATQMKSMRAPMGKPISIRKQRPDPSHRERGFAEDHQRPTKIRTPHALAEKGLAQCGSPHRATVPLPLPDDSTKQIKAMLRWRPN
jgi:hypothetical protein